MRRSIARGLLLALGAACAACSSDTTSTPTPTPTTLTDTFDGTLTRNGAVTHPFIATASGNVQATLVSESPDSTLPIGMSIGTFNGSSCSVGSGLFKDNAVQGSALLVTASGSGSLCVRMYDVGNITGTPVTYQVTVMHP